MSKFFWKTKSPQKIWELARICPVPANHGFQQISSRGSLLVSSAHVATCSDQLPCPCRKKNNNKNYPQHDATNTTLCLITCIGYICHAMTMYTSKFGFGVIKTEVHLNVSVPPTECKKVTFMIFFSIKKWLFCYCYWKVRFFKRFFHLSSGFLHDHLEWCFWLILCFALPDR